MYLRHTGHSTFCASPETFVSERSLLKYHGTLEYPLAQNRSNTRIHLSLEQSLGMQMSLNPIPQLPSGQCICCQIH